MAYKIKNKPLKEKKTFKVLIRGDDMFDQPFKEVTNIEAKTEKEAIKKAKNINGVYEAEIF